MNLQDPTHWKRLVASVTESRRKLGPFREKRTELLKSFMGSEYSSEAGASTPVYLALLKMAADIFVRQLAVRAPTALVTSPYAELRPQAKNFSLACKDTAKDVNLGQTLRRAVTDSLFSPKAVIKVGLESTGTTQMFGETVDMTDPFVRKISFDDYVCDMSARSANLPAYEGDMYYLTKEAFRERYPGAMKDLATNFDELSMQDQQGNERAEAMSHEHGTGQDSFQDKVALQDIWIPELRQLATYLHQKDHKPLGIIYFDSPEDAVYHSLWYTSVPDNAMPLQPFGVMQNLHEFVNNMLRRIVYQAENQKRVVGFNDEKDANRFSTARDGDGVWWNGPKPENLVAGGVDQMLLNTFIQAKDLFSWAAGNLDSLGGLSPMSDTLGQDELLAQGAGAQLKDMQDAVSEFTRKLFRQIAWYEWTDPVRSRVLQKEIPGAAGEYIAVDWNPETREGDFLDFNFNINPHSMREDSPATKLQKLQGVMNQFLMPNMQFMQQQGKTVDMDRLVELIADYANLPELEQLIIAADPEAMLGGEGPAGNPEPGLSNPNKPNGVYTRINRAGATRVGKDKALQQRLSGGKVQPSEEAAIARPVG